MKVEACGDALALFSGARARVVSASACDPSSLRGPLGDMSLRVCVDREKRIKANKLIKRVCV